MEIKRPEHPFVELFLFMFIYTSTLAINVLCFLSKLVGLFIYVCQMPYRFEGYVLYMSLKFRIHRLGKNSALLHKLVDA